MHCLSCLEEMNHQLSWSDVFILKKSTGLCDNCFSKLEFLTGDRCRVCSRISTELICTDCVSWKNHYEIDPLEYNYSLFHYNDFMQELISKWKYRGDYVLGEIFRPFILKAFKEKFHHLEKELIAVPIPLSKERIYERGFNQAEMLAAFVPIKKMSLLKRVDGEKQSKKSRKDRLASKNPFFINGKVNKDVLLVDDIYTTGVTLRHAASLLRKSGCQKVYSLTLIRG